MNGPPTPLPPPGQSGFPWGWVLGCGCLGLVGLGMVALVVLALAIPAFQRSRERAGATPRPADDRARQPAPSGGDAESGGPPQGKYGCRTYGVPTNPIYVMSFQLRGSRYTASNGAGGSYGFDAADSLVSFDGGALRGFVGLYVPKGGRVRYHTGSVSTTNAEMIYLRSHADHARKPGITDGRTINCALEK
jgi:hypothetical protein